MKVKDLFEKVVTAKGVQPTAKKTAATAQLLEMIRTKCKNNFDAVASGRSTPLYRSTNTQSVTQVSDYVFADISARPTPRKSLTGSNYVLSYVSQSKAWKNVPKRDISSSCTPNFRDATQFSGTTWLIIPYDDVTKLAKCEGDFNYLMKDPADGGDDGLLSKLGYLDEVIDTARDAGFRYTNKDDEDDKQIQKENKAFNDMTGLSELITNPIFKLLPGSHRYSLEELDILSDCIEKLIYLFDDTASVVYKDNKYLRSLKRTLDDFEDNFNTRSLGEWFADNITPAGLKIKVYKSYVGAKIPTDSEVWFEGSYIGIAADPGGFESTVDMLTSEWFKGIAKQV
jgi:hypothetical protein